MLERLLAMVSSASDEALSPVSGIEKDDMVPP
jgi:hypothetical protein